jgi:hypothetical protein
MALWVPPKVSRELQQKTDAYRHEVLEMVYRKATMDDFNRDLKQIDPYLELIWAPGNANAVGLKPNRYHILRHVPGGPPSLWPIETEDGEYMEPNSGIFDMLRRNDMWHAEASYDRKKRKEALKAAEERHKRLEREALSEEVEERWKAATRTQVLMSPDVRWAQNASGRRGRRSS